MEPNIYNLAVEIKSNWNRRFGGHFKFGAKVNYLGIWDFNPFTS